MKLRSIALAGVAALALTAPAMASDATGWYLGLGAGWDTMMVTHTDWSGPALPGHKTFPYHDDVLGTAAIGYKFDDIGLRTELELGYEQRALIRGPVFGFGDAGGMQIGSAMADFIYDVPIGWWGLTWSIGGGIGVGNLHNRINLTSGDDYMRGVETGFMWQGITGISMPIADNIDLFADYRYRTMGGGSNFVSDIPGVNTVHLKAPEENVALLGVRWYFNSPEPEAPPPPPPPPPPPRSEERRVGKEC